MRKDLAIILLFTILGSIASEVENKDVFSDVHDANKLLRELYDDTINDIKILDAAWVYTSKLLLENIDGWEVEEK